MSTTATRKGRVRAPKAGRGTVRQRPATATAKPAPIAPQPVLAAEPPRRPPQPTVKPGDDGVASCGCRGVVVRTAGGLYPSVSIKVLVPCPGTPGSTHPVRVGAGVIEHFFAESVSAGAAVEQGRPVRPAVRTVGG